MIAGLLAAGLVAVVLSVPASILFYRGLKHRSRYREFSDAPVKTPATVSPGETVFVTGRARSTTDPPEQADGATTGRVVGPVSQKPGVLTMWEICSLRRWGMFHIKRAWAIEAMALDTNGFYLVDDGHQIAIPNWSRRDRFVGKERLSPEGTGVTPLNGADINGLWMEVDAYDETTRVQPHDRPPDRLADLERRADIDAIESDGHFLARLLGKIRTPAFTRRYRDVTVEPDQPIIIRGTVDVTDAGHTSLQLTEPDEGPALITTIEPETLQRRYRYSYWKWIYGLPLSILFVAVLVGLVVSL